MHFLDKKAYRRGAVAITLIALLFYGFFDISKHNAALAAANPYLEDPFDAVGSFGVQIAVLGALLALLRTFRPYLSSRIPAQKAGLALRAEVVVLLGAAVTLASDGVAMARDPSTWMNSTSGRELAVFFTGLCLITIFGGVEVLRAARPVRDREARRPWLRGIWIFVASMIVLGIYQPGWRAGIPGALAAAITGMALGILSVWALASALIPAPEGRFEDVLDDLAAMAGWIRVRLGFAQPVFEWIDRLFGLTWVRALEGWLNPRKHAWNIVILAAAGIGSLLLLAEVIGEGGFQSMNQLVMVAAVFIGIEGCGVALGYGLLSRYLGLFRAE